MAIEHSTEIDDIGKQYIPESARLATDRGKSVKKKNLVDDPKEWVRRGTNRTDLRGFDTKSAKERSKKSVIKELKGIRTATTSGEDALIEEPDRFLKYFPQQLSKQEMEKIVDFKTFKDAIRKVFGKDKSLANLFEDIGGKDTGYMEVFNTDTVQQWVRENTDSLMVEYLMQKNNIERGRASDVWRNLTPVQKNKVISKFMSTKKVRVRTSTKIPTLVDGKVKLISQRSASGRTYQRRKPMQWTDMQETFIKNNKQKGWIWVEEFYNKIFPQSRTLSSMRNKFYRLKKR